ALVRRHGPMVLGVCRRLVRHAQDAEDCFQAAFLVLAQRAGSVRSGSLASWLYGVAYRVCLRCRRSTSRRCARERQVGEMPQPEVPPAEPQDWRPLLDEALAALPEKYRAPVVLCDLEGKSRKEAARLLRLPEGTLSAQLARARALLAGRLSRRGVALSGAALAAALAGGAATAAVPAQLALSTAKVAALVAAGRSAAVGSQAALLMHEFQRGMLMAKLKVGAVFVAAAGLLCVGGLVYQAAGQPPPPRPVKAPEVRLERGAGARDLTEVELLRKEVDILKLQVEVLQQQVRALRGQAGGGAKGATVEPPLLDRGDTRRPLPGVKEKRSRGAFDKDKGNWGAADMEKRSGGADKDAKRPPPADKAGPNRGPAGQRFERRPADKAPLFRRDDNLAKPPADYFSRPEDARERLEKPADAVRQAEAALKALREARDPEARRRATDALERAVKQLRGPADKKAPNDEYRRP
ncbi:MAG TPA: sigma-70 family RNA polymerase sigma factor, partial [Gemmataceae bacterium]|nr:sigma-70 family RNA polymerase sigma factor [Gemmataceae bacterium]